MKENLNKDEKLDFEDRIINNKAAYLLKDISESLHKITAIVDSKNFDRLSKDKQEQLTLIKHHLASALGYCVEYFVIWADEEEE